MFSDLADGMKYVWRDPTIRMLIAVNFLIVIVSTPYTMLLPGFVRTVLCVAPGCSDQQSAYQQGWLQSVQGVGALIGALTVASAVSRNRGKMMIFWGTLLGVSIVGFAISHSFWITLPIMVLIGAGQSGRMAIGQVLIQSYASDEYRGRVSAVWFMQFSLVQFGTFIVGTLAEFVGIQLAIGGLAVLLVVAMGAVTVFMPRMRQLE
jgi:MFS family permease